jgi:hypothetical protein
MFGCQRDSEERNTKERNKRKEINPFLYGLDEEKSAKR